MEPRQGSLGGLARAACIGLPNVLQGVEFRQPCVDPVDLDCLGQRRPTVPAVWALRSLSGTDSYFAFSVRVDDNYLIARIWPFIQVVYIG